MKEYKLLKKLMNEFEVSLVLHEHAKDDDLNEAFEDVLATAEELHGALEAFIEKNKE